MKVLFVFYIMCSFVRAIDRMPCTDNVDANAMNLAHRLMEDSTPPGYRLTNHYPIVQTGRNPHRWVGIYERRDNIYNTDCHYLTGLRQDFKQYCPLGCEISQAVVATSPNGKFIQIEFLVNCKCTKLGGRRRRRNISYDRYCDRFQTEKSTCTGIGEVSDNYYSNKLNSFYYYIHDLK